MASQIMRVVSILKKTYPDARIVLNYGNNWELLVAVVLSAQCTDKKVNEVTSVLFQNYRSSNFKTQSSKPQLKSKNQETQEIINFASVDIKELERAIRATGFYRNKAKNIQAAAKMILGKFGGKLPRTMAEMVTIPGVARKTANVVLGNAYGVVEGIAVDTHVHRLSQRLRLVDSDKIGPGKRPIYFEKASVVIPAQAGIYKNDLNRSRIKSGMTKENKFLDYYKDASPEKVEQELMKIVPKKDWFKLTYLLIEHGRLLCKAQNPICTNCMLRALCPVSRI